MNLEASLALVKDVGEEIVTEEELRALLASKPHPIAYDGFEPSGTAHIAQGVMRAINVNKMTQAGCRFKMFVADWHAWANNKMGGDLERIQTTGKYLIEIWRATGMDLSKVDFVWASEFIEDEAYWKKVMNIARDTSLDRVLRTTQIMGRSEKDKLSASQILYPCMQAADIFHLQADITQLGMDQRKVNMLAREVGPKLGLWKPVVVSHHMLMGLQAPPPTDTILAASKEVAAGLEAYSSARRMHKLPELPLEAQHFLTETATKIRAAVSFEMAEEVIKTSAAEISSQVELLRTTGSPRVTEWEEVSKFVADGLRKFREMRERFTVERATAMKMSKSNPDSAIFMTDTPDQVKAKMKKAYCPEKRADENPVLEYFQYIVFERFPAVKIERPAKYGGDLEFRSYDELRAAFEKGELHPMDAKGGCAAYINKLLDPVREHFEKDPAARDLKAQVERFQVTR